MRINKIWLWFIGLVVTLIFFSSLRIVSLYYYHVQMAKGNHTLGMVLMDKANVFDLCSYLTGGLHFSVIIVLVMIILNK